MPECGQVFFLLETNTKPLWNALGRFYTLIPYYILCHPLHTRFIFIG